MGGISALSDHFYNWSDSYETKINISSSPKAKNPAAQTSTTGSRSARFFNRTVQALWQAWMQVCPGPGPWAQVLFVSQQVWAKAPDGLRATGLPDKGQRVSGESPQNKDDPGRALRNQPRAFAPQGKVIARSPPSLRGQRDGNVSGRCRRDRNSFCQYARASSPIRFWPIFGQGGEP